MAQHFEAVWDLYHKMHQKNIPLVSTILAAAELASPDLEAMLEAHLAEAVTA